MTTPWSSARDLTDVQLLIMLPDGSFQPIPLEPAQFGFGDWGRPDIADPEGRPHAGFQDLLTAVRGTQDWDNALFIAEADGTQARVARPRVVRRHRRVSTRSISSAT